MPRSCTTLSTQDPDYNKMPDLFLAREYENVLPGFIRYCQDDLPRRTDLEAKDRLTALSNMCESAYGCRRDGAVLKDGIHETFFEYFPQHKPAAAKPL